MTLVLALEAIERHDIGASFDAPVTASGNLQVCTWAVDAGDGSLDPIGCGAETRPPLAPGAPLRTPTVEVVRLPQEDAEGDYLRGHLDGGVLKLDLWRIAPKLPPTPGFVPPG